MILLMLGEGCGKMYVGLKVYRSSRKSKGKWWALALCVIVTAIAWIALINIIIKSLAATDITIVEVEAENIQVLEQNTVSVNEVIYDSVEHIPGIPLIMIDPGHGGEDEGCSNTGIMEKDINLNIAILVQAKLTDLGFEVIMTRETDVYVAKEQRVEMANYYMPDIYVSIHQNSYEGTEAKGIETWFYGENEHSDSEHLAQVIHQQTVRQTGAVQREVRSDGDFSVIEKTKMPACLIETGFLSNREERELLNNSEYQEQLATGIAAGIELYFNPKTMYLTFDDGPSAENTSAILDILKERNIKATFFVIGEYVSRYPEVAQRIVAEGHAIGIHCNQHDYRILYKSVDSYIKDFEKAYQTLYEVTGVEVKMFRFPGGSINAYNKKVYKDIIQEMTKRGFVYYDWNASLEDAVKNAEPQNLIANARESTLGRKKVILLAHDTVSNTVLCLDELLDQFPEYKMEVLNTDVAPIQFRP